MTQHDYIILRLYAASDLDPVPLIILPTTRDTELVKYWMTFLDKTQMPLFFRELLLYKQLITSLKKGNLALVEDGVESDQIAILPKAKVQRLQNRSRPGVRSSELLETEHEEQAKPIWRTVISFEGTVKA
jgi:hypothetical protein